MALLLFAVFRLSKPSWSTLGFWLDLISFSDYMMSFYKCWLVGTSGFFKWSVWPNPWPDELVYAGIILLCCYQSFGSIKLLYIPWGKQHETSWNLMQEDRQIRKKELSWTLMIFTTMYKPQTGSEKNHDISGLLQDVLLNPFKMGRILYQHPTNGWAIGLVLLAFHTFQPCAHRPEIPRSLSQGLEMVGR